MKVELKKNKLSQRHQGAKETEKKREKKMIIYNDLIIVTHSNLCIRHQRIEQQFDYSTEQST